MKVNRRKVSFWATETQFQKVEAIAKKRGTTISETYRFLVEQQLSTEAIKSDTDFIRKQLRDELEIAFEKRMNRIIKLLIKIGSICYPLAYYNTMLGAALSAGHDLDYHQMLANAKRDGARYLGVANEAVDVAFVEMFKFDTDE